jgi:hypothetical protein
MAFNPFHRFRKNQKVWMAALVLMSMFSFVAIGSLPGMGDFLSFVTEMFGAEGRSPKAGTLYGQTIHEMDVQRLQKQRQLAHWFVSIAVGTAANRITAQILQDVEKWEDKADAAEVRQVAQMRQAAMDPRFGEFAQRPEFAQVFQRMILQAQQEYFGNIRAHDQQLERVLENLDRNKKPELVKQVEMLRQVMQHDLREQVSRGQSYFGGSLNMTPQEAFDFLIWQHQADRLGITLVWSDIFEMLQRRTFGAFPTASKWPADLDEVVASKVGPFSIQELRDAVRDEFRVQLAKQALLGPAGMPLGGEWPPATPYQSWEYYKQQRTENTLALLPVPVSDPEFIRQVKQPTKKDLEDFFNKHKELPYDPASPTPGFKQPPRLKIGWLGLSADSPAIRKEVEATARRQEAAAKAAALVLAGARGVTGRSPAGIGLAFTGSTLNELMDDSLRDKYFGYSLSDYKYDGWSRLPSWTLLGYLPALYTSMNRQASVAATVGQILGGVGTQAPPLAAAVSYPATVQARDSKGVAPKVRDQIIRNAFVDNPAPWLALANPGPLGTAALWVHAADQTEPLSFDMMKPRLVDALSEEKARNLVKENIDKLRDELEASSAVQDWAQAEQYQRVTRAKERRQAIARAVGAVGAGHGPLGLLTVRSMTEWDKHSAADNLLLARTMFAAGPSPLGAVVARMAEDVAVDAARRAPVERAIASGLYRHGQSARAADRFEIDNDRGLRPLRRAAAQQTPEKKLWELFFTKDGQPEWPISQRYKPPFTPLTVADGERSYLYWSTAEQPTYVPTFAEAEKRVKQAWLVQHAREYARKEAEKLADEAGKAGIDGRRVLEDEAVKHPTWGRVIPLNHVAPLLENRVAVSSREVPPLRQYTPQRDLQGLIEYPTEEMVTKLLELKKPGEAAVLHDRPEGTYYVALLERRDPPDEVAFYKAYSDGRERSELMSRMEQDSRYVQKLKQAVMEELRAEAGSQIAESYLERWAEQQRKNRQ